MDSKFLKLVFLDVDGVITSMYDTPGSYINHSIEEYGPSPSIVKMLKDFCVKNSLHIVISSNWRRHPDTGLCGFRYRYNGEIYSKEVYNPLPKIRELFGDLIVGCLPKVRHVTKAEATILWFEENGLNDKDIKFVIFDDDVRENFQSTSDYNLKNHFILTDYETGITKNDLVSAEKILNN